MVNFLIGVMIAMAPPSITHNEKSDIVDSELEEMASYNCPLMDPREIEVNILKDLIKIESEFFKIYNIPNSLKGILITAACKHGVYAIPGVIGWPTGKSRIIKMGHYHFLNYKKFAYEWMNSLIKQRNIIEKNNSCKKQTEKKKWISSWPRVTTTGMKKNNSTNCNKVPSNYKLLKIWYRDVKKARRVITALDGC